MASVGGVRLDFSPRAVLAINQAVALASEQNNGRHVGVEELAKQLAAPIREVRAVGKLFGKAGFVEKSGGAAAPLRWRRDPETVSLYDIAVAVGDRLGAPPPRRRGARSLATESADPVNRFLRGLDAEIVGFLKTRKLNALLSAKY